jgi:trans-aconitate 2-methyltransferase
MSDWDAAKYHKISDPQLAWGRSVAARLIPAAGERILDLGCGTGRLTQEIAATPGIFVVGLDRSASMLEEAAARSPEWGQTPAVDLHTKVAFVRGDGAALPFDGVFDAVFSTATFHWIPNHDSLFRSIHHVLKPGGRLVAQGGGAGNLDRLYGRARRLMRSPRYARFFATWSEPHHFENVADTEKRLTGAGFDPIDVSLVFAPVPFDGPEAYTEFVAAVCLRHQLDCLPVEDREGFMGRVTEEAIDDDPPLTLDYWRLNILARKAGA